MCFAVTQSQTIKSQLDLFGFFTKGPIGESVVYPLNPLLFGRIHPQSSQKETLAGQYGLVPPWVDDAKGGLKFGRFCYNARSESIFEKPSFKDAILRQRALIAVDSFYEFPDEETPLRHRYKIRRQDGEALLLAGLWAFHPGYGVLSCSIVTTGPMELLKGKHSRSPLVLKAEQVEAWMDPALKERKAIAALLGPADSGDLVLEAEPWAGKQGGQKELPLFDGIS